MTVTDELLQNARRFAEHFDEDAAAPARPTHVAVVACMDPRLDPRAIFGLATSDAHVIRNAGGVVTDDVIRSLVISQRLLGTTEIMLVHHTDCGMLTFRDDDVKDQIAADTGVRPPFALEAFHDLDDDVRQSAARILASPFIPHKNVRGFVYEVETRTLREVS
jgi:carbonic anhydrase